MSPYQYQPLVDVLDYPNYDLPDVMIGKAIGAMLLHQAADDAYLHRSSSHDVGLPDKSIAPDGPEAPNKLPCG